jgi:hypothetical protein
MADLDPRSLPVHVGIIMDGNGRWAASRGKPRTYGHREGLNAAKRVVKAASDLGLKYLSLYTFSTENWTRAREEVDFLMFLLRTHLRRELAFYRKNQVRVVHSGDCTGLPHEVLREVERVAEATAAHRGTTVNLAINYGGRDEIVSSRPRPGQRQGPGRPVVHGPRAAPRPARPPAPRPGDPHRRGAETVELSPVGERLRGAVLQPSALARLGR